MKKYPVILIIFIIIVNIHTYGQPNCHVEHYGLADGLPQRTIMSIIQDKKGFMWFSTWDGLCKFDGYNFVTYKSTKADPVFMKSNRIDKIHEDKYGDIWLYSYNKETFRFNPRTEKFVASFSYNNMPFLTSEILPKPSGKIWLTSETMGAICVPDSSNTSKSFNIENNLIKSNCVHTVFEDSMLNSWILTDNGLAKYSFDENNCSMFFSESIEHDQKISFTCAFELDDEIWFGTDNGHIWRYQKNDKKFKLFDTETTSEIVSIQKIVGNMLIILTSQDGFLICDAKKMTLNKFNRLNNKELPTNQLVSCYIDKSKNAWIEVNYHGVIKYNIFQNTLKFYTSTDSKKADMKHPPHFAILEDKNGGIWIHPRGGGFSYYNSEEDKLVPFYNSPSSNDWKFSNMLHDIYLDKQGNIWMATRSDGLEKIVFDNNVFKMNTSQSSFGDSEVRAIFEDRDKNIWIAYKNNRIQVFDKNKKNIGILHKNGTISPEGGTFEGFAYTISQDKNGNIWIGTKGDGIYLLERNFSKKELSFHIKQFKNNPSDIYSLSNNNVYDIHEDKKGRIWIGTYGGGLNLFNKSNNTFENHRNNLNNFPIDVAYQIRTIESDNRNIYIGTTLGLIVFSSDFESVGTIDYKIYTKDPEQKYGLNGNDIFKIYNTDKGVTYIATFGGGLSKVTKKDKNGFPSVFKTYNTSNGLPSDVILSIVEDNAGYLWVSTEGNLSKFDPQDESFEVFSDVSRLMGKQYFSEACALRRYSGEIIFGCTGGTLSFIPENMSKNEFKPYLALIKFRLSNKEILLEDNIDDVKELVLSHEENFFSIEYAALDYVKPQNIQYAYRLDGFDKEWIYNQKQRIVNYTNLAPGEYTFRVKSTNSSGSWVDNEHILHITIKPSFWQTKWAYAMYLVATILILFIIFRTIFIFYRMKDRVILEQEQTEMKTKFFTDISHEIRTPLTMIVSPVEYILGNEKTHPDLKPQLKLILKNTNRMLRMVNQILDFKKMQKQKMNIQEIAIGEYIMDICSNFFKTDDAQAINLKVNNKVGSDKLWIDKDSIEKLVYNLVSNAIKYTNSEKMIEVNVFYKDKYVALQVKDEGLGMTKEILSKLFTRFASFNTDKSKPSTGIGLSIVKEAVDKHHAKIIVDSDINRGSVFTVLFQTGIEHFMNDENVDIEYSSNTESGEGVLVVNRPTDKSKDKTLALSDKKQTLLVVEDDADLRNFIKTILVDDYNVIEAENGKDGYAKAVKNHPDFILSDIMMPEVSGIELLQKIRNNDNTSHIPFILLTAKTSIDDKLDGFKIGADDYITKPFNVSLLKAKINSIFQQRRRIYNFLTEKASDTVEVINNESENKCAITHRDELFIKSIQEEVEKNIDNSDFVIEHLVAKVNMSRTVFFNKVKSLTGVAPIEFVREIRIKHAAHLLKKQEYMIKEIVYMVGFSDIRYFTLCFKEMYGMTPSQYRDQFKNK